MAILTLLKFDREMRNKLALELAQRNATLIALNLSSETGVNLHEMVASATGQPFFQCQNASV